jgi:hypothetical protein
LAEHSEATNPAQPSPTIHAARSRVRTLEIGDVFGYATRHEPLRLILTVGRDCDPAEFGGPQPTHVHIERYLSQSLVLPACDLVVSH